MTTPAQHSLRTFYTSVLYRDPLLASLMSEDILAVSFHGLMEDPSAGQAAANSLREKARELPEVLRRVLDQALTDLGYE